jgi:arabinose-5-phosphate isomerase
VPVTDAGRRLDDPVIASPPAPAKPAEDNAELTLTAARTAIRHEAQALEELASRLDTTFVRAVDLLQRTAGRVVVSGLGKSGAVGRKLAATLACTGTPAFFVHAAEAHHGDLGMVLPEDTLLAISFSGRTAEVVDFARAVHGRGSRVLAIAGHTDTPLGALADVTLALHVVGEADPMGITPTTSTTATIALGDALAVALMTLSGFGTDEFHERHPGGDLGERLSQRRTDAPSSSATDEGPR